jgi:rubrerythrin
MEEATMKTNNISRRQFMTGLVLSAPALSLPDLRAAATPSYPATLSALQFARDREMALYYRYMEYARQAKLERYAGIAYLFTAFASAEFLHAQNFNKILTRLGVEIVFAPKPEIAASTTKANLLQAAAAEREDVDSFYPGMLGRLQPEHLQDAVAFTTYAWESEKQHRSIIGKILRWVPSYFERVAKKIDAESGQYFVCQSCGSTVNEVPLGRCPICQLPSDGYRRVEAPV